jgi:hypothetical protein
MPPNFDLLINPELADKSFGDRTYSCSGTTRIAIPQNAHVIMQDPFVAYYYPTAKGNVGYLRIPHYNPQPGNDPTVLHNWMAQYEYAVHELEANTVGMIIDQDHNCGGSIDVVNQTIALFMDKPFRPSQFELMATRESYLDLQGWMKDVAQNTLDFQNMQVVLDLVKNTWLSGTARLTPKTVIDGTNAFAPNYNHYTKPVVILIDEMAGSGGDMFPSMMQGLGRAKLFGQTTMGLGGHVSAYPAPLPNSQLKFTMTHSLFYNPAGVAIENHGAVPDQTYTISRDDVLGGFKLYQKAYTDYLLSMVPSGNRPRSAGRTRCPSCAERRQCPTTEISNRSRAGPLRTAGLAGGTKSVVGKPRLCWPHSCAVTRLISDWR